MLLSCFFLTNTAPCMPPRSGRFCSSPSPRWEGSDSPSSPDQDQPMAQPKQNCLFTPPPMNYFSPCPLMKCPSPLLVPLPHELPNFPQDMPNPPSYESLDLLSPRIGHWVWWPSFPGVGHRIWWPSFPGVSHRLCSIQVPTSISISLWHQLPRVKPPMVSCPIHLAPYSTMEKVEQITQVLQEEAKEFRWNLAAKVSHT